MLNAAKADGPTDDLLMLLNESELLFIAEVPTRGSKDSRANAPIGFLYSRVASEIVSRLHDCFLLFGWVPAPLFTPCWFCAEASAKWSTITRVELSDRGWKHIDQFANLDWRSPNVRPIAVDIPYFSVGGHWTKLSRLCQIDHLEEIFTNPNKQRGLIHSAQEYSIIKAEEFLRARYARDVVIERSPALAPPSDAAAVEDTNMKLLVFLL
jgi:hypothetical protein